jgi:2-(1,2-epoxy-1,2-dihydrophenyl)acetyl-CoA isomerase
MSDLVLTDRADGVLTLTMNRPEAMNALTVEAMSRLADLLEAAASDSEVRAVVITGAGAAFSAGGDIAFLQSIQTMPRERIRDVVYGAFQRVPRTIRAMEKPVIAAVNGPAVGAGCSVKCGSTSAACPRWAACSCCRRSWGWRRRPNSC